MAERLVLQLQQMASESSQDIEDLLRKALIVATKLGIDDFRKWITNELNGYSGRREDIPGYRTIPTQLRVVNRWRGGLDPIVFGDQEVETLICQFAMPQRIAVLQSLARQEGAAFHLSVSAAEAELLWRMFNSGEPLEIVRVGSRIQLLGIIDAVRTTILEWALRLEAEGILGEGMTFSSEEKERAARSQEIHIANFQGVLGDVSHSAMSQTLQMNVSTGNFDSLASFLGSKGVEDHDLQDLRNALTTDGTPKSPGKFGPRVSEWIGRMTGKAASGTWAIGLGAAGDLLAKAIAMYYGLGQ